MTTTTKRAGELEHISTHLLSSVSLLSRLLARQAAGGLSRTEAGVLRSLTGGSRRITELAELEGLAQPTTTLLVKRLEEQRLVRRERQRDDQRVVLVSLTDAGRRALEDLQARVRAALHSHLEAMPDERLAALAAATEALDELSAALLGDVLEPEAR
jgi:DNA-binding MarR family transcriptional regulator